MFYELYIYCKIIFIIHSIYSNFDIKVSCTSPYLLTCPRAFKIIELALTHQTPPVRLLRHDWRNPHPGPSHEAPTPDRARAHTCLLADRPTTIVRRRIGVTATGERATITLERSDRGRRTQTWILIYLGRTRFADCEAQSSKSWGGGASVAPVPAVRLAAVGCPACLPREDWGHLARWQPQ